MNLQKIFIPVICFGSLTLSGCGQSGPLYLPGQKPPIYVPEPDTEPEDEPEYTPEPTP